MGALTVYAAQVDAFGEVEHTLLERLAGDLSFAIGALRARATVVERDQQLRQAAKMEIVGRLTSGIVHDFNNLLGVVQTCGSELAATLPDGPLREMAKDIVQAGQLAAELTRQVLGLGRVSRPVSHPVSPAGIVEGMKGLLERVLGPAVALELRIASQTRPILVDSGHFEQVLLNLCINSRDAMPSGGTVTVTLGNVASTPAGALPQGAALGPAVELQVIDLGSGMSKEVVSHLFEPFFTTKPEGKGTGLGLSVLWGIVQHYGGKVAVESKVGEGTRFRVFFPIAAPPIPSP